MKENFPQKTYNDNKIKAIMAQKVVNVIEFSVMRGINLLMQVPRSEVPASDLVFSSGGTNTSS